MGRAMFSAVAILLLGLLATTVSAEITESTENEVLTNSTANETMTSDAMTPEAASEGGNDGGGGDQGGGGSTEGGNGEMGDGSTATGGSGTSGGEGGDGDTGTGASGASGDGGSDSSDGGNATETGDNTASGESTEASDNGGGDGDSVSGGGGSATGSSGSGDPSSGGGSGGDATSGDGDTTGTTGGGSTGQESGGGSTGGGSPGGNGSTGNNTDASSSSSSGGSGSSNSSGTTEDDGTADGSSTGEDTETTETIATTDGLSIPKDLLTGEKMLLIRVTKGVLSSEEIAKFLEKDTDEHNNFKNAVDKIKEYLKTDAQVETLTPEELKFEGVVRVDVESVRADYAVPCTPAFEDIKFKNDLIDYFNPKDVFNMDGTDIYVKKVPVPKKENVFQSTVSMIGEEFKPAYKDQKSTEYIEFKENFETKMLSDLRAKIPDAQVISVVLLELRKGSLIATSIVNTESSSSPANIQSALASVADDPNSLIKIENTTVISPTYIASGAEAEEVKPIVSPEEEEVDNTDKDLTRGTVTGFIHPEDIDMKYSDPVGSFMKYFVSVTIPAFCVILFCLLCLFCCTGRSCQALCGKENTKAKTIP